MSHETPTIQARPRSHTGSRYSQRLRKEGLLPAVIYGHKIDPVAVSVDEKALVGMLRQGAHVINVAVEGGSKETCLVKDLQFGYLGDNVIHADFARVNLDEEVHVQVHLHFVGTPESAEKAGAILSHTLTELEVICRVRDIPEEIKVDLAGMETAYTVGEIELPPNVRAAVLDTTLVANVTYVHAEEDATGEEAEVETDGTQPEVISDAAKGEEGATKESTE